MRVGDRTLRMARWQLVLLGLTLAGLLLRLWGVRFGLPYSYHIDEHFYYPFAWAMGQGQLNLPDQSHGPSLYLVLLLIGQQIAHALLFSHLSTAEFGALIDSDPWPYMLSARIVSVLAGALTIPVVYWLGKRYRDSTVGLIAAALMAVLFIHVRDSHFGVPDSRPRQSGWRCVPFKPIDLSIWGWQAYLPGWRPAPSTLRSSRSCR